MEFQHFFNALVGAVGLLAGWTLKRIWTAVDNLQVQDQKLAEKVQHIELLVAGDYVKRDELSKILETQFIQLNNKLDRLEQKIDGKMDK